MTERPTTGLRERLQSGPVVCAEGYLFELERRGYLQAGAFVPEVVLENPDKVAQLEGAGIEVVERVPHRLPANPHNQKYLATKRDRTGHQF